MRTRFLCENGACLAADGDGVVSLREAADETTRWRVEEHSWSGGYRLRLRSRHGSYLAASDDGRVRAVRTGEVQLGGGVWSTFFWLVQPEEEEARLQLARAVVLPRPPQRPAAWPHAAVAAGAVAVGAIALGGVEGLEAALIFGRIGVALWQEPQVVAGRERARQALMARRQQRQQPLLLPPLPPQLPAAPPADCIICLETQTHGASCVGGHFLCRSCLNEFLLSEARMEPAHLAATRGALLCPHRGCESPPFPEATLAALASPDAFEAHLAAIVRSREAAVVAELEAGYEARLAAAQAAAAAAHANVGGFGGDISVQAPREAAALAAVRRRLVDELLTARCPSCRAAFLDFAGCFALSCSRCGVAFCGWCLSACGADAHPHVRDCAAKPPGHRQGDLFGTVEEFEVVQRRRMTAGLRALLGSFPDALFRAAVLDACRVDLEGVGIDGAATCRDLL